MKRLTLIAPDGTQHELTPEPGHSLALRRGIGARFVDVYEEPPQPRAEGAVPKWLAQIPTSWAVFNGDA